MRRDVFQGIADPNRRYILDLLSKTGMNLNTLSEHFTISRPAISKHVKILHECGLIKIKQVGRERFCEASVSPLKAASKWLESHLQTKSEVVKPLKREQKPTSPALDTAGKKKSKKKKKDKKKKKK